MDIHRRLQAQIQTAESLVAAAQAAGADDAEVYATWGRHTEVNFQKNDLDQAMTGSELKLGLRVFKDKRMGFATTNQPADTAELVGAALAMAAASPPDPHHGLPAALEPVPWEHVVDETILGLGTKDLAHLGMDLLARIRAKDPRVTVDTANVDAGLGLHTIVSSTGVRAAFASTWTSAGVFGMAVDGDEVGSFAYDTALVRRAGELRQEAERVFDAFVDKCVGALGAQAGESFRGPIFIPPDCLGTFLIGDLVGMLGADMVRLGRSPLADSRGELIAAPGFTLVEGGPEVAGFPVCPFDREGTPRVRTPLVENGVLKDFLFDSYEGRAAGRGSTGHAAGGADSAPRCGATTLEVLPGDQSLEALAQMERGVIVTRFSGSANPISGDFSGVVKGGFLVVDGEKRPIHETTLAGNLYDCLKNISGISREVVRSGTEAYPGVRIEDIAITAG
jgi:PmbA protein